MLNFKNAILRFFNVEHEELHNEDNCDSCNRKVGKEKLIPLPYYYKDLNDKLHRDMGDGYRHYSVCKKCWKKCTSRPKIIYTDVKSDNVINIKKIRREKNESKRNREVRKKYKIS